MKVSDSLVQKLRDVFTEVGVEGSLEDCLSELSGLVARVLSAQGCSILMLNEVDAQRAQLCDRAGFGMLPGRLERQLSAQADRQPARAGSAPAIAQDGCGGMESMFSTIVLQGKVIGVIHASRPQGQRFFDKDDLDLFSIVTPIITKSIQVIQLQQILRSRFTQVALTRSDDATVRDLLSGVMQNPNQIARILAKSFYREMLNAGFNFNQIIFAATEVISELSSSVRKHSVRRKQESSDVEQRHRLHITTVSGELSTVPVPDQDPLVNKISA